MVIVVFPICAKHTLLEQDLVTSMEGHFIIIHIIVRIVQYAIDIYLADDGTKVV